VFIEDCGVGQAELAVGAFNSPLSVPPHLTGGRRCSRSFFSISTRFFSKSCLIFGLIFANASATASFASREDRMGVLGRAGARDVELPVWPGVVVLARGVRVRGVLAAGGTAPGIAALGVVARGVAVVVVVVVVVVVLPPQPATQHRATSTANPQLKLLMAEHSTPSFRHAGEASWNSWVFLPSLCSVSLAPGP
jgi:hypothetical protein